MQFILGFLLALILTVGAAYFFLKRNQFSILLVAREKKSAIFMKKSDFPNKGIIVPTYSFDSNWPIGSLGSLDKISTIEMSRVLYAKDPSEVEKLIKIHFPREFEGFNISYSIISLLNILVMARDSRQIKHIDAAVDILRLYIDECSNYYNVLSANKSIRPSGYQPGFNKRRFDQLLRKLLSTDMLDIEFAKIFTPWEEKNGKFTTN